MRIKRILFLPILCLLTLCFSTICLAADGQYTNEQTGYQIVIEDDADLLTDAEEASLLLDMKGITTYGNVAFKSLDSNSYTTSSFAELYSAETFGTTSNVIFVIDMDNREIYIYSNGAIYNTITRSKAYVITDNVYTYASNADYYGCAQKAYEQINILLEDGKIAQPMKYISNFVLAILFAILINFLIAYTSSKTKKASVKELVDNTQSKVSITNANTVFVRQSKTYSPVQKSSGSSGGGGGRSSSGGGGGHKF